MKKLTILLIASVLYPMLSFGQANTITLVASGDGASKTEAESLALRSAIEQAFGTFVSANTTILNDDIVKDEIATISSGNIESYNIVAESETDGRWYVSVKAVVSINKLVEFAKSHGSSTEFAGQNFAMQMKMRQLNKENEEKALSDLLAEVEQVASKISFFDYSINQEEPKLVSDSEYEVPIIISATWNQNGKNIADLISRTFSSVSMSINDYKSYASNNYPSSGGIPLEEITGERKAYILRSDSNLVDSIIEQLRICFLRNLHCFSIVRKGNGEEYKTFLCSIWNLNEEFGFEASLEFKINPALPEKVLYETEGFEVIPDPTLGVCKPQMVDLGLSVKWADMNVGGSPVHPYGNHYAWGELCPKINHSRNAYQSGGSINWDTYKWYENKKFIKYNEEDSKIVLELDDDVAHVEWGGNWRMPTLEEWRELKNNCTWTWTAMNGVYGQKFTSKKNGNSIFLPATNVGNYPNHPEIFYGRYWSSSMIDAYNKYSSFSPYYAYCLYLNNVSFETGGRFGGYSVRPVSE